MKEKSYAELMKASAMKRKRKKEAFVLDLYVDMVISDAILNRKLQAVKVKLDKALDCKNKKCSLHYQMNIFNCKKNMARNLLSSTTNGGFFIFELYWESR